MASKRKQEPYAVGVPVFCNVFKKKGIVVGHYRQTMIVRFQVNRRQFFVWGCNMKSTQLANESTKSTMNSVEEKLSPSIGMEATIHTGSDRRGGTITRVSPGGKTIWVQEDLPFWPFLPFPTHSTRLHTRNTEGPTTKATLRGDGKYRVIGGQSLVSLGVAETYRDPSF